MSSHDGSTSAPRWSHAVQARVASWTHVIRDGCPIRCCDDSPDCFNRWTSRFDRDFACWPATRACGEAQGSGLSKASRLSKRGPNG